MTAQDRNLKEDADSISAKMLDYLVEIYRLNDRKADSNPYVSTSQLADLLGVTAPAVNRMVTRLREQNLLHHEPYQGIRLTEQGEHEARLQLRLQRIAEVFLVNVMGFTWDIVHEEARKISVGMSEALTNRMWEMAGKPEFCPHGEVIPNADGTLPPIDDVLLTEATPEVHYKITRVLTRESDRLNYMSALGLVPDAKLQLIHAAPFSGPMQLKLRDEYRIIGHNLAELIRVKPE
jgi:DtxR family transcriptional regulator, Mn-dependent transcriptional regulator